MKKLLCVLLTLSLIFCAAALADGTYDENDSTASTTLTTTITDSSEPVPTYTIIIPSELNIVPNVTSTQLDIQVTAAENVSSIQVKTDANGTMTGSNGEINFKVSPYELTFSGDNILSSKWMSINIDSSEWEQAAAGTYTGTLSFTISATLAA